MKKTYPYDEGSFNFYGISVGERISDKLNIKPLVYETTFQVNGHKLPEPEGLDRMAISRVDPYEGLMYLLEQIGERTAPTGELNGRGDAEPGTSEYLFPDGTNVRIGPESVGRSVKQYGVTAACARVRSHSPRIPVWLRDVFAAVGAPVLPYRRVHRAEDLREEEGVMTVHLPSRKERILTRALADAAIALFEPEAHRAEGIFTYEADVKRYFSERR